MIKIRLLIILQLKFTHKKTRQIETCRVLHLKLKLGYIKLKISFLKASYSPCKINPLSKSFL